MIKKTDVKDMYFLSPMQEGMLFHYIMDKESPAYFEQTIYSIEGEFDYKLFEQAFNLLIERHDILRTIFVYEKRERPVQVVLKKRKARIYYQDISHLKEEEKMSCIKEFKTREIKMEFDLAQDIPMKFLITRIGDQSYEVIWSFHHIIIDGWCAAILIKELLSIFNSLKKGEPINLSEPTPYSRYINWLEKQDKNEGIKYWNRYLQSYEAQAVIPKSEKRKESKYKQGEYRQYQFKIDRPLTQQLSKISEENKITPSTIFQALWALLLQKYNNTDDVGFGIVVSGRSANIPGVESMVGLFINTIPLRVKNKPGERFNSLVKRVQEEINVSKNYEYIPLAEIQANSELKQQLINHILIFENYPVDKELKNFDKKGALGFSITNVEIFEQTNYDLDVTVVPSEVLHVSIRYNSLVYEEQIIERIEKHFLHIFQQVVMNPQIQLKDIGIITGSEKKQILSDFNNREARYPKDKTIHQLFAEQVERTPDHTAIVGSWQWTVGNNTALTYRELNEKTDRLAYLLKEKGVGPDTIAGIMMERSIEMMMAILAILKAGGAYLPIEPTYPEERKQYMLKDSNACILLTQRDITLSLPTLTSNLTCQVSPANLAYIIYTSGSTGKAKGVIVEHLSVVNLLAALHNEYPLMESDNYLLKTSYIFDVSVAELFGWFLGGGGLAILEAGGEKDPEKILAAIERGGITHINFVPSMFHAFLKVLNRQNMKKLASLKYIFLAGEALLTELVDKYRRFNMAIALENIYGPTEGTVYSSKYSLSHWSDNESIPIGKPLPNIKLYILDKDTHLQPVAVPGELCISGIGVARGYINNPELTAEKFIFISCNHYRSYMSYRTNIIYKTGDLARWLPDGNIEFLGRIDHQVKIRGFRVELGDIESHLLRYDGISEAVVVAREDEQGDNYLCAYVVSSGEDMLPTSLLRAYLSRKLPGYMVPGFFVPLEKIPLTPTGKVDRKLLPSPGVEVAPSYTAPGSEEEKKLVGIWSEVLGAAEDAIGIQRDFYELGGHSLKAIILASKIHKAFNVKIPLEKLFKLTIKETAQFITHTKKEKFIPIEPIEKKEYYVLSSVQKRLYTLHQLEGDNLSYHISSMMTLEGELDRERFTEIFRKLIRRHESFRTSFDTQKGEPIQWVHSDIDFDIDYFESSEDGPYEIGTNFRKPFKLSQPPLLRVGLIRVSPLNHLLVVDMYHIIADGTSTALFIKEFMALYQGNELPPLRIRYKDYAQWQNREKEKGKLKKQEEFWTSRFKGDLPLLNLPADFPGPGLRNFEGSTVNFHIGEDAYVQLKRLCRDENITLYMMLLAIYMILLSKVSGQEDIIVGTTVEGRQHDDLRRIVGMFVNLIPLRNYPKNEKTFVEFLKEVKESTLAAFENQAYPLGDLLERVVIKRDSGRNPLFDVMFEMHDFERPEITIPGLHLKAHEYERQSSKFDMTLFAIESGEELLFILEYSIRLFPPEIIEIFIRYFQEIVSSVIDSPHSTLSQIKQISRESQQEVLLQLNEGVEEEIQRMRSGSQIFQHRLMDSLKKFKNNLAIEYGPRALTYGELDKRSNHIANRIVGEGLDKEAFIAVLISNKIDLICTLIGILKAGCVMVPLDPTSPQTRLQGMINSTGIKLILVDNLNFNFWGGDHAAPKNVRSICLDEWSAERGKGECRRWIQPPQVQYQPGDRIYIYFTSGSTGNPKAILGKNKSLLHFVEWEIDTFGIDETFRGSQLTAPSFDAFLRDIFVPLCAGGVICIPENKDIILNSDQLTQWIEQSRVMLIHCVPGLFRSIHSHSLTPNHFKHLKFILFSGERIEPSDLSNWYDVPDGQLQFVNLYGPTETTLIKTYHIICKDDLKRGRIPVGKPIRGSGVLILDDELNLCDKLVTGEIYICTPYRTYGYYNNPGLNRERFLPNPLPCASTGIIYKTGDMGRFLADGSIEFLGRYDRQVKIRGIRIELEEIELALMKYPLVKEAVVVKEEQENHNDWLHAYVTEKPNHILPDEGFDRVLREYLAEELPAYMVPTHITTIEAIPRRPNGKVDYDKISEIAVTSAVEYTSPKNDFEKKLEEIWSDILGCKKPGIHGHFFELGGNSLTVMSLITKIYKEFDVRIPLRKIFENSTIEKQAKIINEAKKARYLSIEISEEKEYYPLSSAQKRLFVLNKMEGKQATNYNLPAVSLIGGELEQSHMEGVFKALIQRHEALRTSFMMVKHQPVQMVHPAVEFELGYSVCIEEKAVEKINEFVKPFDLSCAPLLRAELVKLAAGKHILVVDMHHILSDAASIRILIEEFLALYETAEPLQPLKIQYKDFAQWQNRFLASNTLKKQEGYWLDQLAGEIPVLTLPTDYSRPVVRSTEGRIIFTELNRELIEKIRIFNKKTETTLYMLLLSVYNILMSKYSFQEEIIVGSPVVGRGHEDLQNTIGTFANMLAMRNFPRENKQFNAFLMEVKENALKAYENQDYQFEDLVAKLDLQMNPGRNPLFDVVLNLDSMNPMENNDPMTENKKKRELRVEPYEYQRTSSKYDLLLRVIDRPDAVTFGLEYSTVLFEKETVEHMISHYMEILEQVLENQEIKLKDINIAHDLILIRNTTKKEDVGFNF